MIKNKEKGRRYGKLVPSKKQTSNSILLEGLIDQISNFEALSTELDIDLESITYGDVYKLFFKGSKDSKDGKLKTFSKITYLQSVFHNERYGHFLLLLFMLPSKERSNSNINIDLLQILENYLVYLDFVAFYSDNEMNSTSYLLVTKNLDKSLKNKLVDRLKSFLSEEKKEGK